MDLWGHQQLALETSRTRPRFAFFWKPGTGKTIAMLAIQKERPLRTLILAQKSVHRTAWASDAEALGVPIVVAWHKNKQKRRELIETPGPIVLVTNYETFRLDLKTFEATGIDRLIIDESSKVKNRSSKIFQACVPIADAAREVYLLSGTPAPNNDTELWAQLRLLSIKAAGVEFYRWTNYWFHCERRKQWVKRYNARTKKKESKQIDVPVAWHHKDEERFLKYVSGWAWALSKEEAVDLPPVQTVRREVDLSPDEWRTYKALRDGASSLLGELLEDADAQTAIRKLSAGSNPMMKMRQAVSGFVIDDQERPNQLGKSSKLAEVEEILDELGSEPVVMWAEFTHEIDALSETLKQREESFEVIDGRTKRDIGDIVEDFVSGKITRIVAQPQAAGHGTDGLQKVCCYGLYFSFSFNQELYEQSRDRLNRGGQTRPCTFFYLLATHGPETTIDHRMLDVVEGKTSRQDALLAELKPKKVKR